MANATTTTRSNWARELFEWVDARFPLSVLWKEHLSEYYAPKNFNFWYYFGSLSLLVLVLQIITGIFLTMNYKPDATLAFASVEYIMREVPWGWLIRYLHSTGASAFFICIYLHMFRALLYGSYRKPRELVWLVGVLICGIVRRRREVVSPAGGPQGTCKLAAVASGTTTGAPTREDA